MAIDAGETVVLTATFTDENGDTADPSTPVTVTIEGPDSTTTDPMSKVETGVFEYEYDIQSAGVHEWKAQSQDIAIEQGTFYAQQDQTA